MTIKLNDKTYEIPEGTTLAAFIESQGIRTEGVAIAIAYQVIPKARWAETKLTEGMDLMLIRAVSGG